MKIETRDEAAWHIVTQDPSRMRAAREADEFERQIQKIQEMLLNLIAVPFEQEESVLKIVLFPEFMLQPDRGAYGVEALPLFFQRMSLFLSSKPQFIHFMFFFGSMPIAYLLPAPSELCHVENVVPILFCSCFGIESKIVYKKFRSLVDYYDVDEDQSSIFYGNLGRRHLLDVPRSLVNITKAEDLISEIQAPRDFENLEGVGIFTFANAVKRNGQKMIFALEVCLDHDMGRLRFSVLNPPEESPVDIHIVLSCGLADISPLYVVAKKDGYVIHLDGYEPCSTLYQVAFQKGSIVLNQLKRKLFISYELTTGEEFCVVVSHELQID